MPIVYCAHIGLWNKMIDILLLPPIKTIAPVSLGQSIKGAQYWTDIANSNQYSYNGNLYQSVVSVAQYFNVVAIVNKYLIAVRTLSGYAQEILINSALFQTNSNAFFMAASVPYNTSNGNLFVLFSYVGASYIGIAYFNLTNNTYSVYVNNLTNSVLGSVGYPTFGFYDENLELFYYQLSNGGDIYAAGKGNNFANNTKLINNAEILFVFRYGYGSLNGANIEIFDWNGNIIFVINAASYYAITSATPSFSINGIYGRYAGNTFVFFPFATPLFTNFSFQRHFAHNYSRGVPINQGTQNLILPPNRNIIL